jgi:epoxide hydrolase A/B
VFTFRFDARQQFTDLRYVGLIEDTGHLRQRERPVEVNAALLEFLRGPLAD